jgi:ribosomal protein L32
MATPKKKVSKSRRNMRRFTGGNKLAPVTLTVNPETNEPTRPHRVTLDSIAAYIKARDERKAAKRAQAQSAKR